jgi:predicted nucleic acid-binding Zn ribbon protein
MKRTEPKLIGDILDEFFSRPYVARKIAEGRIPQYWREVVGEKIASLTTYCRLEGVILYIGISSGVARQEVFYRRDKLAQRINQRAGHDIVRSIIVK